MGGKQKQSQRTKNNTRPSNSGRSAERLGSSMPQFMSFSGMKETGFTATGFSLSTVDDIDSSVDSNFQLVLKKMNKKDSTTKLKALQEFTELIRNSDAEAIKAILPFWPRLYCALSVDAEHRVREAAHVAHNQVVLKAKRNIAPYLKQVIGAWFTSQYDVYPPASSAATQAFQDAFPANKMQEAITFCQEEILNYICDNLTVHSAQSFNTTKNLSPEDCKAKYERVLISSLQGYSLYLTKASSDAIRKAEELNKRLISNGKFWKYARHEVAQVRSSWFGVLTALCQRAPFLLESETVHVTKAVFGNLDESDPIVQPNIWEAALLTISTIKEWWKYISIEELFLPKLWKVLREAGHGNASVIYPNLLLLLSHLPVTVKPEEFYPKFFDNIRLGLQQKTTKSSQSESRAISVAFVECLQYTILKHQANLQLCERLIQLQLIPTIESCLDNAQAAYKTMFNQISSLVQYWHKNRHHKDLPNYKSYLHMFWKSAEILLEDKLIFYADTKKPPFVSEMISKQMELLVCLKHVVRPKSQLKLQFTDESSHKLGEVLMRKESLVNHDQSYLASLKCLVHSTVILYIRIVTLKKKPELLENIFALIQEFESEDILWDINKIIGGGNDSKSLIDVYNYLLSTWINDKTLCTRPVVDLLFLLFKYLNDENKSEILEKINAMENTECLSWCIANSLSHPHNTDEVVQKWIGTEKIGCFFVKIINDEIEDKSMPNLSLLLKQAFTESNNGDLFISKNCVFEIIAALSKCITSPSDYTLTIDTCASLAAYIASILYTDHLTLTYTDKLLLALFDLSSSNKVDPDTLSKDTMWEVNTAWQDAVTIISDNGEKSELLTLTKKFADILESKVLENEIHDIDEQEVASKIISYCNSVVMNRPQYVGELLEIFFNRNCVASWRSNLFSAAQTGEYFRGQLSYPYEKLEVVEYDLSEENVIKYLVWKNIVYMVIGTPISDQGNEEDDDDGTEYTKPNIYIKLIDKPENCFLDLLQDLVICDSLLKNYKNMKYLKKVRTLHTSIREKVFKILEHIDVETKTAIETSLNTKVYTDCWLWAAAAHLYYVEINCQPSIKVYEDLLKSNTHDNNDLGRLHLTQTFAEHLSYDDIDNKLSKVESVVTLRCLIHCDDIDVQIAEVYSKIEKLRDEDMERNFYNVNFSNWEQTQTIIEIIRLCSGIIRTNKVDNLSRRHWDFIVVSLGTWSAKFDDIKSKFRDIQIASFIAAIGELFYCVIQYIQKLYVEQPNNSYVDEWNNVFVESVTTDILKTWLYIAEKYKSKKMVDVPFLQEFGRVISVVNPEHIFKKRTEGMPKWSRLLNQCCSLLLNEEHYLQLWGYHMLVMMTPGLIEVDSISVGTNTPHEKGLIFEQFKDLLVKTHNIVQAMLQEFKLGEDSCRVEPFTDAFTYTFAYLLIWDVLLELCEKSSTELRYQYADWLKHEDLLNSLLNSIFMLMPSEVLHYYDAKTKPLYEWFIKKSSLSLQEPITSDKIERIVCWVYASTLSQLPASVRFWWSSVEPRTSQIVDRVTSAYVSPNLCGQELNDVADHETKFKNMAIKIHPSVREVIAIYTVDDAQMELVITLPSNYPLGGPDVQCNQQIGGTCHKQWLKQLKICVMHQNGRIWDALSLWNNNLDKKFDGVEECYICFAVLHTGTYQLPKLSCKTCRKKFHAACLFKWFSTSNKSTCPICRNLF